MTIVATLTTTFCFLAHDAVVGMLHAVILGFFGLSLAGRPFFRPESRKFPFTRTHLPRCAKASEPAVPCFGRGKPEALHPPPQIAVGLGLWWVSRVERKVEGLRACSCAHRSL